FLGQFGCEPRPRERIVGDGKLWTAAGVSAGIDLGLTLTAELTDEETARIQQLMIEYDPQPPFDSDHVSKARAETRARAEREMRQLSLTPRELKSMSGVLVRRWVEVLHRKVRGRRVA